jgi:hypothetical protein
MARRYSGELDINLTYRDKDDQYRARVCRRSPSGGRPDCEVVYVGTPKHLTKAVDSPAAYDDAAHAAISFASNDIQEGAASNHAGSGWDIRRRRR